MSCPSCNAPLNRRRDLQFSLVLVVGPLIATLVLLAPIQMVWPVPLFVLILCAVYIVDVYTVRLVKAPK